MHATLILLQSFMKQQKWALYRDVSSSFVMHVGKEFGQIKNFIQNYSGVLMLQYNKKSYFYSLFVLEAFTCSFL